MAKRTDLRSRRCHDPASDGDLAGRRDLEAGDRAQQARLAATARADECRDGITPGLQRNVIDRDDLAVTNDYIIDLEDGTPERFGHVRTARRSSVG